MTENKQAMVVRENQAIGAALSVHEIVEQVSLIQNVMKAVMKDGEHYGKIPGCGDKPALLKPGAEKLGMTFRLAPEFEETVREMPGGHREVHVKCSLYTIAGHNFVGQGVGCCSTMEGKYRFRVAPKTLTDKPVPSAYWDLRKTDPKAAQALLGGPGFGTKKNDVGQWMITEGSNEKVEHDNPADYYNTVLKMGKKRAHVDAILTATAASDIFTQDIEDMPEVIPGATAATAPKQDEKPREEKPKAQPPVTNGTPTKCEATLSSFREANSKDPNKPWTAFFCTFTDQTGAEFEAGTFDKKLHETIPQLKGERCEISFKAGKRAGTFELLSITPVTQDDVPA